MGKKKVVMKKKNSRKQKDKASASRGLKPIDALMESFRKYQEEDISRRRESKDTVREVTKQCLCGGDVVRVTHFSFETSVPFSQIPIGPGSRKYYHEVSHIKTSCEKCGILYDNEIKKTV